MEFSRLLVSLMWEVRPTDPLTYAGVSLLLAGKVERIVLSRPAVEAGERLGFLPGDMREKMDPYLRPLWDALNDRLGAKRLRQNLDDGTLLGMNFYVKGIDDKIPGGK